MEKLDFYKDIYILLLGRKEEIINRLNFSATIGIAILPTIYILALSYNYKTGILSSLIFIVVLMCSAYYAILVLRYFLKAMPNDKDGDYLSIKPLNEIENFLVKDLTYAKGKYKSKKKIKSYTERRYKEMLQENFIECASHNQNKINEQLDFIYKANNSLKYSSLFILISALIHLANNIIVKI